MNPYDDSGRPSSAVPQPPPGAVSAASYFASAGSKGSAFRKSLGENQKSLRRSQELRSEIRQAIAERKAQKEAEDHERHLQHLDAEKSLAAQAKAERAKILAERVRRHEQLMAQSQQTNIHQQLGRRLRSLSTDRGTAEALGTLPLASETTEHRGRAASPATSARSESAMSDRSPSAHDVKRELLDENKARIARRSQRDREYRETMNYLSEVVKLETTKEIDEETRLKHLRESVERLRQVDDQRMQHLLDTNIVSMSPPTSPKRLRPGSAVPRLSFDSNPGYGRTAESPSRLTPTSAHRRKTQTPSMLERESIRQPSFDGETGGTERPPSAPPMRPRSSLSGRMSPGARRRDPYAHITPRIDTGRRTSASPGPGEQRPTTPTTPSRPTTPTTTRRSMTPTSQQHKPKIIQRARVQASPLPAELKRSETAGTATPPLVIQRRTFAPTITTAETPKQSRPSVITPKTATPVHPSERMVHAVIDKEGPHEDTLAHMRSRRLSVDAPLNQETFVQSPEIHEAKQMAEEKKLVSSVVQSKEEDVVAEKPADTLTVSDSVTVPSRSPRASSPVLSISMTDEDGRRVSFNEQVAVLSVPAEAAVSQVAEILHHHSPSERSASPSPTKSSLHRPFPSTDSAHSSHSAKSNDSKEHKPAVSVEASAPVVVEHPKPAPSSPKVTPKEHGSPKHSPKAPMKSIESSPMVQPKTSVETTPSATAKTVDSDAARRAQLVAEAEKRVQALRARSQSQGQGERPTTGTSTPSMDMEERKREIRERLERTKREEAASSTPSNQQTSLQDRINSKLSEMRQARASQDTSAAPPTSVTVTPAASKPADEDEIKARMNAKMLSLRDQMKSASGVSPSTSPLVAPKQDTATTPAPAEVQQTEY